MDPFPLPSFELLDNAAAMLAVFGTVNLYDAETRAVRIRLDDAQTVEIDFYVPGAFASATVPEARAAGYCVTLRCVGVTAVRIEDLSRQNVVADCGFAPGVTAGTRRFWVRGSVGCDLDVQCARIAVERVASAAPAP